MTDAAAKRVLANIKLPPRQGAHHLLVMRNAPSIAEIEAMMDTRGIEWSPLFEARCDAASLALFGITEADTRPREPHPDDIKDTKALSQWHFSDDAFEQHSRALDAWYDWQATISGYERELHERGPEAYWKGRGIDVTDEEGDLLRCFHRFSRQLYAGFKNLLPGARITPDGTGRRAAQSAEEWGAALEAEARRFRASR